MAKNDLSLEQFQFTDQVRQAVVEALNQRKDDVFRDTDLQARFLKEVEQVLVITRVYLEKEKLTDPGAMIAAREALKAAQKALKLIPKPHLDQVNATLGRITREGSAGSAANPVGIAGSPEGTGPSTFPSVNSIQSSMQLLIDVLGIEVEAYSRIPKVPQRAGPRVELRRLISHLASHWWTIFGLKPTESTRSGFGAVIKALFDVLGIKTPSEGTIQSILENRNVWG